MTSRQVGWLFVVVGLVLFTLGSCGVRAQEAAIGVCGRADTAYAESRYPVCVVPKAVGMMGWTS